MSTFWEGRLRDQVYNTAKLHAALDALRSDGIDTDHAFKETGLSLKVIEDEQFRVSPNQILKAFKNISDQKWDPYLPYRIGSNVHLSAYGLYGYALLCSTCYRETVDFATKYHYLAAPTVEMQFVFDDHEEGWDIEPISADQVDHQFYAFLVCLQMGIHRSLHRDVIGPTFQPHLLEMRFAEESFYRIPPEAASEIRMGANRNRFHISGDWVYRKLELGNELTFKQIVQICDKELSELMEHGGVAGQVRRALLENAAFASSMDAIAQHLGLTSRTLRRHLKQENKTFSEIVDSTRAELALRYLRTHELSTEEIAYVLGFSETASFVRAFKRWTGKTPKAYRVSFAA
jgi:AraC-like DNA-binding protein